jgi:hypothetical protein
MAFRLIEVKELRINYIKKEKKNDRQYQNAQVGPSNERGKNHQMVQKRR